MNKKPNEIFLSTPSVGRATSTVGDKVSGFGISIHALRGEGDGEDKREVTRDHEFLSTPSVGRATSWAWAESG